MRYLLLLILAMSYGCAHQTILEPYDTIVLKEWTNTYK